MPFAFVTVTRGSRLAVKHKLCFYRPSEFVTALIPKWEQIVPAKVGVHLAGHLTSVGANEI